MERMSEPLVDAATLTTRPRRRKLLPAAALLVVVGTMVILLRQKTAPPMPIQFLPFTNTFANVTLPIPDRWIPRTWGWLWRTKTFLLGQPRTVVLSGIILKLDAASPELRDQIFPKSATEVETSEYRISLLGAEDLRELRRQIVSAKQIETESAPQMTTAEGMRAVMSMTQTIITPAGPRTAGVELGCFPKLRHDTTDLTSSVLITRIKPLPDDPGSLDVVTNVAAGFRVHIPPDGAALLLSKSEQHPVAVLISATLPKKR